MNGHSCAFLLLEVFRLFPESEGVSGDVFEDVLGIGEVTRGAFVGIRKRVHLMPNLKGSPATGIPPAVAVLQESWHLHTVLYHYIASYRVFVPVVRSFFPKAPLHILSIDAAS